MLKVNIKELFGNAMLLGIQINIRGFMFAVLNNNNYNCWFINYEIYALDVFLFLQCDCSQPGQNTGIRERFFDCFQFFGWSDQVDVK